jgi:hypothetical protein
MAIPVPDCKNTSTGKGKRIHAPSRHDPIDAHIAEILDTLKQKLCVKLHLLR